ncbi:MAG: epoxyqueuosine reductase [Lachnospiraceae bacterium]|nr:epoxyqueuosine reductase [Lachnospiraceae bacterium]
MYTKEEFLQDCRTVFEHTDGNIADIPGIGKVVMYEAPLIGFGRADDPLFEKYKEPEVIGPNYLTPKEWFPKARTVVSFFLPFTEAVSSTNRALKKDPSPEWLYARIEGQEFINQFGRNLQKLLEEKGIASCLPFQDPRYSVLLEQTTMNGAPDLHADSRWSERHAAYVCGLGTFGLSRSFITEKGTAGRFTSILVSEEFQPTERKYTGIYDYCTRCGVCAGKCPAQAISLEYGKNNATCRAYLRMTSEKFAPRYGCGKCQVGVPCERTAPGLKRESKEPEKNMAENHKIKVARRSDWKTTPMPERHETFVLHRALSSKDMDALRLGNVPQAMEDKWFWYMEGPTLWAHRSWTGYCIYRIDFKEDQNHVVTVNRDPKQYKCTSVEEDIATLNKLLDWWTEISYDHYHEWLSETYDALKKADEEK